jgi:hypothetical protein
VAEQQVAMLTQQVLHTALVEQDILLQFLEHQIPMVAVAVAPTTQEAILVQVDQAVVVVETQAQHTMVAVQVVVVPTAVPAHTKVS